MEWRGLWPRWAEACHRAHFLPAILAPCRRRGRGGTTEPRRAAGRPRRKRLFVARGGRRSLLDRGNAVARSEPVRRDHHGRPIVRGTSFRRSTRPTANRHHRRHDSPRRAFRHLLQAFDFGDRSNGARAHGSGGACRSRPLCGRHGRPGSRAARSGRRLWRMAPAMR